MNFLNPNDVTPEAVQSIFISLKTRGVAHFNVGVSPHSTLTRRAVMALLPDSGEIMLGMEGSGCIFVDPETSINPFVFVTAGFQLIPAQIVTKLFVGLAYARADLEALNERAYPQLTHQNRS